uniref:Piwi domain-containing protein n=1 Tax=Panagrolaimus superbus TaxID=310955 RepID=A0A914YBA1_9BILA
MDGLKMRTKQRPNSGKPELVFVFRDGLSEGQILMAKLEELEAIKEGFQEYYGQSQKLPPFVMVLATKRHNRRFYSSNHENVLPGTVVSQGIARLGATEFYMQSAFPIQGTAKLTDYEVIENEAKLSVNDIQAFTHGMCYTHQIVSSAVSLPEPVYLAHELAKRGRNNLICYRYLI